MAHTGMSPQEAFDLLRDYSRNKRVKLKDVARGVVETKSIEGLK